MVQPSRFHTSPIAACAPARSRLRGLCAQAQKTATVDGEREIVLMNWGFPLLQPGKAPRRVTNVRVTSAFWRGSFEERRCLVPASSFCEPNGDVKPATWHWFAIKGDDPRPLFAFAGIWRS